CDRAARSLARSGEPPLPLGRVTRDHVRARGLRAPARRRPDDAEAAGTETGRLDARAPRGGIPIGALLHAAVVDGGESRTPGDPLLLVVVPLRSRRDGAVPGRGPPC